MLARVSAYEALPTAKLQVPTAPAQAGCGFLKGRRESEFSEQASPEAAGGPGRQREEAEVWCRSALPSVAGWGQGRGRDGRARLGHAARTQPSR